jgi:hypothetical protein
MNRFATSLQLCVAKGKKSMKTQSESYLRLFEKAWINLELVKKEAPKFLRPVQSIRKVQLAASPMQWKSNRY